MTTATLHDYHNPNYQQLIEAKVSEVIEAGRNKAQQGLDAILSEYQVRRDLIVRPDALDFEVGDNGVHVLVGDNPVKGEYGLTPHSEGQLLESAGVPKAFKDRLVELKEYALLRHNLNELLPRLQPKGLLLREVGGTLKGVLSTAYKRIDAAPAFESFCSEALKQGFSPYNARNTNTRHQITFVDPRTFLPPVAATNGRPEVILFGLQIQTSDYGAGALSVAQVILRVWCANLAAGGSILRQVHIGRRFDANDGDALELSDRTVKLDERTVVSAIRDGVCGAQKNFKALEAKIGEASTRAVNIDKAIEEIGKKFGKTLAADAKKLYEDESVPVEILPPGNSAWRFSNVLSHLANRDKDADRSIDLQSEAFKAIAA